MCDVLRKCLRLYRAMREGVLFTPSVDCLGIESCQQTKNNDLDKRKNICRNHCLCGAMGFPMLMISTLRSLLFSRGLKIATNPNFDSTSIHCSAATARMKTNLLKDNSSIQFEGEPNRRTPRVLKIENFCLLCCAGWIDFISLSGTFNMFFV